MAWLMMTGVLFMLAACGGVPQHPLSYVKPDAPVWSVNPQPPPDAPINGVRKQAGL